MLCTNKMFGRLALREFGSAVCPKLGSGVSAGTHFVILVATVHMCIPHKSPAAFDIKSALALRSILMKYILDGSMITLTRLVLLQRKRSEMSPCRVSVSRLRKPHKKTALF